MSNAFFILISYLINFVLIGVVIFLIYRIKILERKLITFSPTEAYAIMENMRELTVESQIIADKLESSIKDRESVLEDLSDLVDSKIRDFKNLNIQNPAPQIANLNRATKNIVKDEPAFVSSEEFLSSQNINNENSEINTQANTLKSQMNKLNSPSASNISQPLNNNIENNNYNDNIKDVTNKVLNKGTLSKENTDIKSKIYELYKDGKNEVEIARELGISTTEAKLAISLFK